MSKYDNLPDIDTAPDVYETEDVPDNLLQPSSSSNVDEDGLSFPKADAGAKAKAASTAAKPNENIDSNGLNVANATRRFQKSTVVDGAVADFSGRLRRKPKSAQVYPLHSSFETETYELAGYSVGNGKASSSTSESKLDRIRRLRWEIEELERETSTSEETKETKEDPATVTGATPSAAVLAQLQSLRDSLSRVELVAQAQTGTPEQQAQAGLEWREATRALLTKLQDETKLQAGAHSQDGITKDDVKIPTKSQDASVSQLESKIAALEKFVGLRDMLLDDTSLSKPLSSSVARLEQQLMLLTQPRHLDAISRRVKLLTTELERLHEAKRKDDASEPIRRSEDASATSSKAPEAALDGETRAKVNALFSLQTRLEPLLPLAPSLLARMRSLAALHASSSKFSSNLDSVLRSDAQLQKGQTELQEALKEVQDGLQTNAEAVKSNLAAVEKRMEDLAERIAVLSK